MNHQPPPRSSPSTSTPTADRKRFPSPSAATSNSNTPYTDFVPFGFGAGPQQPQPQHNVAGGGSGFGLKDRAGELKFDYSHAPPPQAQPQYAPPPQYQPYGFNYAYEFQQPQQQQQQQQQAAHGAAQAFMAPENALGMLVSSATQSSDALPLKEDPRASNKYRSFANDHFMHQQSPPHQQQQQQAMFSSSPGDRHDQQFLPLKYLPTTAAAAATQQLPAMDQAQQQHQQQQQQHYSRMVNAANPTYSSSGSFYAGTPTHRLPTNVNMDLVSPAQAAAMGSTFDLSSNAQQQHQHQRNYSLNLRMSQLLPGSNALTNRRKEDGSGTAGGASASGSFDQQSVVNKASVYAEAASASLMSEVSAGAQASTNALYSSAMGGPHHPAPQSLAASHDQVCSLCLGGQCDRISHTCGHRFHSSCLQDWGEKSSCPICGQVSHRISNLPPGAGNFPVGNGSHQSRDQNANANNVQPVQFGKPPTRMPDANNSNMRPPPIDTRLSDGSTPVTSGGSAHNTSTPSSSSTPGITPTRSGSTTSSSGSGRARKNKKLKDCSVPGCDRTVRSRGLCKGHGGGRRCGFAGCGLSDQGGGFCISHGGGKRCQEDGCDNSAQSRGLCKLHGGGSRCTVPNCTKSSQGRGLCRAHGGGRRCMVEGCNKTDRRAGYCVTHGADKKCIVPECSKTGRIDSMCTKHYFERHQPFGRHTGAANNGVRPSDSASESNKRPKLTTRPATMASPTPPALMNAFAAATVSGKSAGSAPLRLSSLEGKDDDGDDEDDGDYDEDDDEDDDGRYGNNRAAAMHSHLDMPPPQQF